MSERTVRVSSIYDGQPLPKFLTGEPGLPTKSVHVALAGLRPSGQIHVPRCFGGTSSTGKWLRDQGRHRPADHKAEWILPTGHPKLQ